MPFALEICTIQFRLQRRAAMQPSQAGQDPSAGELHAGIDVGSVSIYSVVINAHKQIICESPYRRHFGKVEESVAADTVEYF
jgi:hypothetical protein